MVSESTRDRILDGALLAYGTQGYSATSLDALADDLGITKQTILYYFGSKQDLFAAVIDRATQSLVQGFDAQASRGLNGLAQVEAIVTLVMRLAVRQPELVGLVREATRPGSHTAVLAADRVAQRAGPIFERARAFLGREMDAGRVRRSDPELLLFSLYATVMGVASELEIQRTMGMADSRAGLRARRRELLRFLRAAFDPS